MTVVKFYAFYNFGVEREEQQSNWKIFPTVLFKVLSSRIVETLLEGNLRQILFLRNDPLMLCK